MVSDLSSACCRQSKKPKAEMTAEELKSFEKAMQVQALRARLHSNRMSSCAQDPTFRSLFMDVVRDMSDEKTRKEQEEYLDMLESQGALGAGAQLLKPQPSFCVSIKPSSLSKKAADAYKQFELLYINVCHSK